MEPSSNLPPDKAAAAQHNNPHHPQKQQHHMNPPARPSTSTSASSGLSTTGSASPAPGQAGIEKLCRPAAFDKMESIVREMQDTECGVPVRSQKLFLTSIPSAFMGYDLIEWIMERWSIEESEALNIANQLCLHGYFFPVNDAKTLVVKDDSSLYRFQTPYFWPSQHKAPDNIEYAIYLTKRSLRNKQRHGLEEYETDALTSLHKNLKGKWDFITMQAEEQVKLCKERKKGDKIVSDSQEKAYWRVHRPPPGQFTPLESCPVPTRDKKQRKRTVEDGQKEVDFLIKSEAMTRVKMSQACDLLIQYFEVFSEYDPLMQPALPSNPWVSEDTTFWTLNSAIVDSPTEKRVKKWSISIEELVSDPTGLQEFTNYLKKEYSHENIRFWTAVNDLRRSAHSQIAKKVKEIYEEFLEPGAPCEINIDGKTMEKVQHGLKNPTRFTFDAAGDHIYTLLLKKDCYPRFIRSEHYKILLATGIQPAHKKRFFGFGAGKKKASTATPPNAALMAQASSSSSGPGLGRRRGSDRSLTGSAHELAVSGVKDASSKVHHSHSQSNLCDIPYRGDMPSGGMAMSDKSDGHVVGAKIITKIPESVKTLADTLEVHSEASASCSVCPWDTVPTGPATGSTTTGTGVGGAAAAAPAKGKQIEAPVSVSICPWEDDVKSPPPPRIPIYLEKASDIGEVSERMKRSCGLRQSTLDSDFHSTKNLMPDVSTQRRASITITPRISEYQALASSPVQHGASIPGIFTGSPASNTLPVADRSQSYSQQSLSMDSSVSVDDPSVRQTPEAMVTVHQDSMADSVAEEVEMLVIAQPEQEPQQELPVFQVQVNPSCDEEMLSVVEECCDACADEQTLISTSLKQAEEVEGFVNINNGTLPSINVEQMEQSDPQSGSKSGTNDTGDVTTSSRCCCDPMESGSANNNNTINDNLVAGQETVLYDKRTSVVDRDEEVKEEDDDDNNNNNNNPVTGSAQEAEELDSGPEKDNNNRPVSTGDPEQTPSIKVCSAHLKREASIEGDEFMIQSRTASMEQKSDSSSVAIPTEDAPVAPPSSLTDPLPITGSSSDPCETCQADTVVLRKPPINQRQSTDVQSSDMEFEDIPEEGARFLLRGCVAPAPTPAPMIAPLAEVEQDPQDEEEEEELAEAGQEGDGLERVICDKLKQQKDQQASVLGASCVGVSGGGSGLEKQQSNDSEISAKTPPPELLGTLTEANKKEMVEPIPVYACSSTGAGEKEDAEQTPTNVATVKKRRKKREGEGKGSDGQPKHKDTEGETKDAAEGSETEAKGDPVCPWEDENVSTTVEAPFVKTYATLGYL